MLFEEGFAQEVWSHNIGGALSFGINGFYNLRTHLKTHHGEKSNKCNQCDFASHLKRHTKTQWRKAWRLLMCRMGGELAQEVWSHNIVGEARS